MCWKETLCCLALLLGVLVSNSAAKPKRRLDNYVSHYETLDYDPGPVEGEHNRVRRETPVLGQFYGDPLSMHFRAHGRAFRLHLRPDHQVIRPETTFLSGNGESFPFDATELFTGELADEPNSIVSGAVVKGVFRGVIHTSADRFHIEPARRYFPSDTDFHSVIYRSSDVSFNGTTCGVSNKIRSWMAEMQASGERSKLEQIEHSRYSRSANRERRQSNAENVECRIKIAGDYKFSEQVALEEGIMISADPINARAAAARVLAEYVKAVNDIYRRTDFGVAPSGPEMIQFAIQNVQIYLTKAETEGLNVNLGQSLIGVDRFLDLWSQQDLDQFCLAYLFTYRDFDNGVLGLAWVGSSGSSAGGVCDKYQRYSDGISKTLNTGIVTFLNYNKRVASAVSYLTFAHELGHNLGSNHDPAGTCSPGGDNGNYIMYAHATSGNQPNNDDFSTCSKSAIRAVLEAKALVANPPGCFQKISNGSICGNGVREGTEQCDCGLESECASDACCNKNCTLKSTAQCSPQQGPCCNASCTFLTQQQRPVCSEPSDCRIGNGTCNGMAAACQAAPSRPNGTLCNSKTATCYNGECTGSLCAAVNRDPCFCTGDDRCQVCCKNASSSTCTSLRSHMTDAINISSLNTFLAAGSPCDNYLGFCDFLNFCRRLDDQGPIARLKDALFSTESIKNAYEWSKKHWYVVLAGVIGIIIVMALIVKFCSVHTESTVDTMKRKRGQGGGGGRGQQMNNMRQR